MKAINWFLISLLVLSINSCEVDMALPDYQGTTDVTIDKNYYYQNEIFPTDYLGIYGTWYLNNISGGFKGSGYQPDFDLLRIEEIGIYKIFRNDSLLSYGKIEVSSQDEEGLLITLKQDTLLGTLYFNDMVKYVMLTDSTLGLYAPCCDRFNYHFTNCDCYSNSNLYQEDTRIEDLAISEVLVPKGKRFIDVCFTDINHGYLLCNDNTLLKTEDGGTSWNECETETNLPLYAIWFQNKDVGFAVGGVSSCSGNNCNVPGSIIIKTVDGGRHWETKNIPYAWSELHDICFTSENDGYAVGLGLKVKTVDGGENWTAFETAYNGIVKHISFSDKETGYICGLKGNCFKTTNGGEGWNKLNINTTNFLNTVCFLDSNTGFVGQTDCLFKSTDGGDSWVKLENAPKGVYTMSFQDPDRGIVFGSREYTNGNCHVWQSNLNITEDAGVTWKGDFRVSGFVNSASYLTNNKCYIIEDYTKLLFIEY